jgi:hypothetical protein
LGSWLGLGIITEFKFLFGSFEDTLVKIRFESAFFIVDGVYSIALVGWLSFEAVKLGK